MSNSKQADAARKTRLADIRNQQRRRERMRTLAVTGIVGVLAIALISAVAVVIIAEQRRQAAAEAVANRPIEGVQTFGKLTRNHLTTKVNYPQTPPVGGDHAPVWQDCGAYPQPVPDVRAVHSLEHGAVWIGYQPNLPAAQVEQLTEMTRTNSYLLVSPVKGVTAAAVVSSWGKRLVLDSVNDPRLATFIRANQQGPDTPEPGAACSGGSTGTGDG